MVDKLKIGDMVLIKQTSTLGYVDDIYESYNGQTKCRIRWLDSTNGNLEGDYNFWGIDNATRLKWDYEELRQQLKNNG